MERKLYRDEAHKTVAGVCAGLAEYFNVDVSIIRVLFLLTLIGKGAGGLLYLILWAVLPKKPYEFTSFNQGPQKPFNNPYVDYTVPPVTPQMNPEFVSQPKKSSSAGVIVGCILVVLGTFFIVREFGLIPHFYFGHLWPLILIGVGIAYMASGSKQPWEQSQWNKQDSTTNNNPPTEL